MVFLKITAVNGTITYIPDNQTVRIVTSAASLDAGSVYSAPKVIRGIITEVAYMSGVNAASATVTVTTGIPAYTGTGAIRYEYGIMTWDGAFNATFSN